MVSSWFLAIIIILYWCVEQALQSGQVPADLNLGNINKKNPTDDHDASKENDGPADMEQVLI